jgi:hypothetical protein
VLIVASLAHSAALLFYRKSSCCLPALGNSTAVFSEFGASLKEKAVYVIQ